MTYHELLLHVGMTHVYYYFNTRTLSPPYLQTRKELLLSVFIGSSKSVT